MTRRAGEIGVALACADLAGTPSAKSPSVIPGKIVLQRTDVPCSATFCQSCRRWHLCRACTHLPKGLVGSMRPAPVTTSRARGIQPRGITAGMSDCLTVRPARSGELEEVGRLTLEAYVADGHTNPR